MDRISACESCRDGRSTGVRVRRWHDRCHDHCEHDVGARVAAGRGEGRRPGGHPALAAQQVRHAADRWLTSREIAVLGRELARSIDRYEVLHRRPPTWAEALAGVDPVLLAPLHAVPDGWPYRPAFWRRELRQHLMAELRRTRWISYTRTPRSLQPGEQGRGWLRSARPLPDTAVVTRMS